MAANTKRTMNAHVFGRRVGELVGNTLGTSGSRNGNTTGNAPVAGKTPGPCGHFVKHVVGVGDVHGDGHGQEQHGHNTGQGQEQRRGGAASHGTRPEEEQPGWKGKEDLDGRGRPEERSGLWQQEGGWWRAGSKRRRTARARRGRAEPTRRGEDAGRRRDELGTACALEVRRGPTMARGAVAGGDGATAPGGRGGEREPGRGGGGELGGGPAMGRPGHPREEGIERGSWCGGRVRVCCGRKVEEAKGKRR